jgi:hypothetical protein
VPLPLQVDKNSWFSITLVHFKKKKIVGLKSQLVVGCLAGCEK